MVKLHTLFMYSFKKTKQMSQITNKATTYYTTLCWPQNQKQHYCVFRQTLSEVFYSLYVQKHCLMRSTPTTSVKPCSKSTSSVDTLHSIILLPKLCSSKRVYCITKSTRVSDYVIGRLSTTTNARRHCQRAQQLWQPAAAVGRCVNSTPKTYLIFGWMWCERKSSAKLSSTQLKL